MDFFDLGVDKGSSFLLCYEWVVFLEDYDVDLWYYLLIVWDWYLLSFWLKFGVEYLWIRFGDCGWEICLESGCICILCIFDIFLILVLGV